MMVEQTRQIDRRLEGAGLPPLQRSAWVEVDIDRLTNNARALCALAKPASIAAVVKADGYGHGLEMAARCAVVGGAEWLCVADSAEATRLRSDGYEGRIFVLYPVPTSAALTMARLGIDVTLGSRRDAQALSEHLTGGMDSNLDVHLEIDTGMTRGGVSPAEAVDTARAITTAPFLNLTGIWTHLARPEDADVTAEQLLRFDHVRSDLSTIGIDPQIVHAAASGGLLVADISSHDLVRPGLAFYGLHPGAGPPLPSSMRTPLAVKAHAVRIASVPPGTSVGYAGTWTTPRASVIATLPIGYADGWARSSSPGTSVLVEGTRAPVVGRISSDSLTVDVTGIAGVGSDSEFTLIGAVDSDEITVDEIADVRGTISWEVLQQLSSRLARVYLSGDTPVALRPEMTIEVAAAGSGTPVYQS